MTDPAFATNFDPDTRNYHWQALAAVDSDLPTTLRYWLTLPTSLTQALKLRADNFSVQVLEQRQISLALPIDGFHDQQAPCPMFSRKVLLKQGDTPWVAAHTLIPVSSLAGGLEQFTQLANKPLGELLFATPGVHKDHLQVCSAGHVWGRRTRYLLHHQPLLVSEFFLPELILYEHKRLTSLRQTHST